MPEQRSIYAGEPSRAWIRVQLDSPIGEVRELDLVVDTGNPCAMIVDEKTLRTMLWRESLEVDSNFGSLAGGWLCVKVPDISFDHKLLCHGNDRVDSVVKNSDLRFDGLIGLPFLRMMSYGGDGGYFWIRSS